MRRALKGSSLLTTVDAFMAVAAYGSYAAAGSQLDVSATTAMRQVEALELWLRRVLIFKNEVSCTQWGSDFVPTAQKVLSLIDSGGLRSELSKTRVHPDGVITIEGQALAAHQASLVLVNRLRDAGAGFELGLGG